MKRRINKNKVYELIGKAVVTLSVYAIAEMGLIYAVMNCITVYK